MQAFEEGPLTDDLFMANAFSLFIQHVAAAGRAEYEIPLSVYVTLCNEESRGLWHSHPGLLPAWYNTSRILFRRASWA